MATIMLVSREISVPFGRLILGVLQGLALSLLYSAAEEGTWPATNGHIFAPLFLIVLFGPVLASVSLGNIRGRTLTFWAASAMCLLSALAIYGRWRAGEGETVFWLLFDITPEAPRTFPSAHLIFALFVAVFISQCLIVASDADRKLIARYGTYFDSAWKLEVQLLLSLAFVAVFWLLLHLGASLFELVKLDFLTRLIRHRWFSMPATTLALACAIHATDARTVVTRGIQTLIHKLLSWLLPLIVVIVVGFLMALIFTGLAPLWSTRHATSLLLTETGALILLINTTYQDGQAGRETARLLRYAGSLAALALAPLVAIAAYALLLRVAQYGWTASRIIGAACVVVAACYALGYLWAVLATGAWLKRIEACNIVVAFVILALILALFTPIADPSRLSVADQVARLRAGAVPIERFDFAYLRFEGAKYGREALEKLKVDWNGDQAALVRDRVEAALRLQNRLQKLDSVPLPQDISANLTAHPRGRSLPESFIHQDWNKNLAKQPPLPLCLTDKYRKCDAFFADVDTDGVDEIVLTETEPGGRVTVFKAMPDGTWRIFGISIYRAACEKVLNALRAGSFKIAPAGLNDFEIDGHRLHFQATSDSSGLCN
jgi:hypothetical protein